MAPSRRTRTLAQEVDAFSEELMREAYRVGAGLVAEGHEARIYARWSRLFRPAALGRLPAGPPKVRSRLREFVQIGRVDRAVTPWSDRKRNRLIRAQVEVGGKQVPFYSASIQIAHLADRGERRELYRRLSAVRRSVRSEEDAGWAAFQEGTRSLGYAHGLEAATELLHLDVPAILSDTARFTADTERLYREVLAEQAGREGLSLPELRAYDAPRLLRGVGWTPHFPASGIPRYLRSVRRGLGLPEGSFRSDLAPRPRKNPRAFCAPVRVPEEVYLVLRPHGGQDDYHTALHEMGHALHFGLTDAGLDPTLRRLGDSSLTEGWAFVLDLLFLNPSFRRTMIRDRRFSRFFALSQLHLLRRYCGKIDYESRFFRDPLDPRLPERYVRTLTSRTLFREDEAHGMRELAGMDVDPWMYTACYLRAWMFAGKVTQRLEERWGEGWWHSPSAGAWLARAWSRGMAPSVEELLEEFGAGELSLRPLSELVRRSVDS